MVVTLEWLAVFVIYYPGTLTSLRTIFDKGNYIMRFTLFAAILIAFILTACGRPNQALPEVERENYERIIAGEDPDNIEAASSK